MSRAAARPASSCRSRIAARPPQETMRSTTARPSPEAPPVTTAKVCWKFMGLPKRSTSFEADGRVHSRGDGGIVEPARRDGLGLRVELHRLLAVRPEIAE